MTDPNGSLHNQSASDVAWFDGHQWQASRGGGADPFGAPIATRSTFYDGTVTAPERLARPSHVFGRTELVPTGRSPNTLDPKYNATVWAWVVSLAGNFVQPTAIAGYAQGEAVTGVDMLGGSFSTNHLTGSGGSIGIFVNGTSSVATVAGLQAIQATVSDFTGVDFAYQTNGSSIVVGVDVDLETGGTAHYGSVGVQVRSGGGPARWDVGFGIPATGGIRTAGFEDDSDSPSVLKVTGTHTYIVNNSAAGYTFTWHGPFTIDDQISITRATQTYSIAYIGTGTGATTWGTAVYNTGAWTLDEFGVATRFQIAKGTPGANLTSLYVSEGATPTLRRLTTFDPGNLGVNFTAGQLVAVLV